MTLRVPTNKAESVGMRKLSPDKTMQALATLRGKPNCAMWSRRAQNEAKINSGDLVSIAEAVRDLFRPTTRLSRAIPAADLRSRLHPLARELGAMEEIDERARSSTRDIKAAVVHHKAKVDA
jgi:CarD family transcriptional regulator